MAEQLDQALVMTSVIWVAWVLAPAVALSPEIIKGVKAVVTWLSRVGIGHHAGTVTPSPDSALTGARLPKPATRLLAAGGIEPVHVCDRADHSRGPEVVRAA